MNKKHTYHAGIIGSGFAARFHYDALTRVNTVKVEIEGAFSINIAELNDFTTSRGIKSFDSLHDIILSCDVLHVCTPPSTHEKLAIEESINILNTQ
jgi:predicted dehydrogenase